MNTDLVIFSLLRTILPFIGGILSANGYISSDEFNTISGGLLSAGAGLWAIYANKKRNQEF